MISFIKDKKLLSWALFDWANSAYPTVIQTFLFSAYFTKKIAPDPVTGSSYWMWTMSLVGLFVALSAPVLGGVADKRGRRKPVIGILSAVCIVVSCLMWFVLPEQSYLYEALLLAWLGSVSFELLTVFYNAMLPGVVDQKRFGSYSGFAWSLGYFGSLLCIGLCLFLFVFNGERFFGLNPDYAEPVRACFIFVGFWFFIFGLPMFLLVPDEKGGRLSIAESVRQAVAEFKSNILAVISDKTLVYFFAGRMLFMDALLTVFAAGGVYAAGVYGMEEKEVLLFAIAVNFTSGTGALLFGYVEDRVGVKKILKVSILGLLFCTVAIAVSSEKIVFWIFGLLFGIFVGPAQSASRTYVAAYAKPENRNQLFGMLAFSGKATAFAGPALFAGATALFASQQAGLAAIIPLYLLGYYLISKI